MSEVRLESALCDNMATGSISVPHARVHSSSYAGHGGVWCYASHCSMCIPKRLFKEGKCRRNTFSIFPLQGRSLYRDAQRHRHFSQSGSVCNAKTWAVTNYSHGDDQRVANSVFQFGRLYDLKTQSLHVELVCCSSYCSFYFGTRM